MLPGMLNKGHLCYYFGDDHIAYRKIRKHFGECCQVLLPSELFHQSIKDIEKEFLRFIHNINYRNLSEYLWWNSLASRNSAGVPLLKQMAYYQCAVRLMKEEKRENIVFICESLSLAKILYMAAARRGIPCDKKFSMADWFIRLKMYLLMFLRAAYFLIAALARWGYATTLNNNRITKDGNKIRYVLRSWVTAGCLDRDGQFMDRNFGQLANYLKKNEIEVWTIPMFFNLDRNVFSQMKVMAQSGHLFLFPEQYITPLDIYRTLRDTIAGLHLNLDDCQFDGIDFSHLVREIHYRTSLNFILMACNTVKYALKNLSHKGIRIDRFIYPMECNAPEKSFILACKKFYPETKVIGYQHTVWFKEQLGVFLDQEEISYHPLPEQIILSGRRYLDILPQAGFPKELLYLGPNLRYTSVYNILNDNKTMKQADSKSILLILNFDTNQNLEFLAKVNEALQMLHDIRIFIKSHPLYSMKNIDEFLNDIKFPPYTWIEGSVQDCVVRVDAVLMSGGSVSNLETMATGVPLIRISLDSNFDFDCLWDDYPFAPFLHTAEDIRKCLLRAFQVNDTEKQKLKEFGRILINNYFEPVTEGNLRIFLKS